MGILDQVSNVWVYVSNLIYKIVFKQIYTAQHTKWWILQILPVNRRCWYVKLLYTLSTHRLMGWFASRLYFLCGVHDFDLTPPSPYKDFCKSDVLELYNQAMSLAGLKSILISSQEGRLQVHFMKCHALAHLLLLWTLYLCTLTVFLSAAPPLASGLVLSWIQRERSAG